MHCSFINELKIKHQLVVYVHSCFNVGKQKTASFLLKTNILMRKES